MAAYPEGHNPKWWRNHPEALAARLAEEQTVQDPEPVEAVDEKKYNQSDSWTILGIVLGIIFVVFVPNSYAKAGLSLIVCAMLMRLAHRSHWVSAWSEWGKTALSLASVSVFVAIAVPQLCQQWVTEHPVRQILSKSQTGASAAKCEPSPDGAVGISCNDSVLFQNVRIANNPGTGVSVGGGGTGGNVNLSGGSSISGNGGPGIETDSENGDINLSGHSSITNNRGGGIVKHTQKAKPEDKQQP